MDEIEPLSEMLFPSFDGEFLREVNEITDEEMHEWEDLPCELEVVFGTTTISLKELAALTPGALISLDETQDELCEVLVNGQKMARGRIVQGNDHYGIQILSFNKNHSMLQ